MPARTTNGPQVAQFVTRRTDTYPFISVKTADLSGKSVLITGASKGIGKSTACSFAAAGCSKIAIAARSTLEETVQAVKAAASAAGRPEPQVLALSVDVTAEASVQAAAVEVDKAFGGTLDVLITNAGYLEEWLPIAESNPTEWWKTWQVNINGTYLCTHFFLPLLLKSELKTLVTLSSAGAQNIRRGASAYQNTKFATCRFAEFADQEYNDQGLIAFAIHPGGVKTELALNMPEDMHQILTDTPELCADTLVWLVKERREWLAGRYISVGWDMDELQSRKEEIVQKDLLKFRLTL